MVFKLGQVAESSGKLPESTEANILIGPEPVYFYKVPGKCNTFPSLRITGLDTEIILGILTNSQRPFSSEAKKN